MHDGTLLLVTGHSLGGALAQIAAMELFRKAHDSGDTMLQAWLPALACVTFAAPTPFAPAETSAEGALQAAQSAALHWMRTHAWNCALHTRHCPHDFACPCSARQQMVFLPSQT